MGLGRIGLVLGVGALCVVVSGHTSAWAAQGERTLVAAGRASPRSHDGNRWHPGGESPHRRSESHGSFHYDRLGPSIDRLGPGIRFDLGGYEGQHDHGHSARSYRHPDYRNIHPRHRHAHRHDSHCDHILLRPNPRHYYGDPYGSPPSQVTVVVPPPVYVTTPYYCEPCAVGFVGVSLFHRHIETVHDIDVADIEGSLVDVGHRIIFGGY